MVRVQVNAGLWSADAVLAQGFLDRLLGNFRAPPGTPVLLRTRSIHTFGQRRPLSVVGIDAAMTVVDVRSVSPNRVAVIPGARLILEVPAGHEVPDVNQRIAIDRV
jgi:hypothetical protein